MHFHQTPADVVKLVKRHIPKKAKRILEPAVGEGALLDALQAKQFHGDLTLVDIDARRLDAIKALHPQLSLINADFLRWSNDPQHAKYDLIITNPPFSNRAATWVQASESRAPIEYVFIERCIKLLEKGGTLIAIVPDSLINSERLVKGREWIFSQGMITFSYQLPDRIFHKIEGAFYLIVFKKAFKGSRTTLRNTDNQQDIKIEHHQLKTSGYRLDHSYYRVLGELVRITPRNSIKISCISTIGRGPIRNNYKRDGVHHSNSFDSGLWNSFRFRLDGELCIAIKRVARDAHLSIGLFLAKDIEHSTDCLIFLRAPQEKIFHLLFYLRTIFANSDGKALLLKGAGAKFISVNQLSDLPFFCVAEIFPNEFRDYIKYYLSADMDSCFAIEHSLYTKLIWGQKISLINNKPIQRTERTQETLLASSKHA